MQYGSFWNDHNYEGTEELFDRLGGPENIGSAIPMKHLTKIFAPLGSTFGLTASVPEAARVGRLADAHSPVRIYLRTDGLNRMDYPTFFGAFKAELDVAQQKDGAPYIDYASIEEMMDDGWVVD